MTNAPAAFSRILFARPPQWSAGEFVWLGSALAVVVAQRIAVSLLDLDGGQGDIRRVIFFTTTALLVGLALRFRWYIGAWLIAIGILMNFIPMASHGGLMPVAVETIQSSEAFPEITEANIGKQVTNSKDIVLRREDIDFEPLSDRFVMTLPLYRTNIYSLGDFVAFAGIALAVVQIVFQLFVPARRSSPAPPAGEEPSPSNGAT